MNSRFDRKTKTVAPDTGHNTLAVYAMLQGGLAVEDERLIARPARVADARPHTPVAGRAGDGDVFLRRSRHSPALFNRPQDRQLLMKDVGILVKGYHNHGAYGYTVTTAPGHGYSDNSNSQYGALGVWSGARRRHRGAALRPGRHSELLGKRPTQGRRLVVPEGLQLLL